MKLCICSFNVPVAYNDGRPVEAEVFDAIERALECQFDGYTDEGYKTGSWHGMKEVSAWYRVYVPPERIEVLRKIINAIGVKLEQKQMALEIGGACAELIDVVADEPDSTTAKGEPVKKRGRHEKPKPIVLWNEDEEK